MKFKLLLAVSVTAVVMTFCTGDKSPVWHPAENPLFTVWGENVDPSAPWPEYPRPGLVREEWMSLNGLWDYAICGKEESRPAPEGKILVPFPVELALSGVRLRMTDSLALWYSREFELPRAWRSKQIILNFEASDWETSVWIDDNLAMNHHGGYDPFTCNISPFLSDSRKHSIVVRVTDPTDKGQAAERKAGLQPGRYMVHSLHRYMAECVA